MTGLLELKKIKKPPFYKTKYWAAANSFSFHDQVGEYPHTISQMMRISGSRDIPIIRIYFLK